MLRLAAESCDDGAIWGGVGGGDRSERSTRFCALRKSSTIGVQIGMPAGEANRLWPSSPNGAAFTKSARPPAPVNAARNLSASAGPKKWSFSA